MRLCAFCMCFRSSQKNDFRRFLPFSGDFHKPSMSISKFFISCFTDHPDTPACGRFLLKLSTWLYTNQWFLGGKPVGNARIAGGWIVDYPHGSVDNFFKANESVDNPMICPHFVQKVIHKQWDVANHCKTWGLSTYPHYPQALLWRM